MHIGLILLACAAALAALWLAREVVLLAFLGVLIGKLAADVVFYIPTVAVFELRRHYAERARASLLIEA